MKLKDKRLLAKIRKHLFDLHTKWANDPNADGHHKSNEGYVGVILHYPNWWKAEDYLNGEPEVLCEVYSYLFGPNRLHKFNSMEEAWEEVSKWSYENE